MVVRGPVVELARAATCALAGACARLDWDRQVSRETPRAHGQVREDELFEGMTDHESEC